jgi:hypothetical protein
VAVEDERMQVRVFQHRLEEIQSHDVIGFEQHDHG